MKIDEIIMQERRLERLKHLTFFLTSDKVPVNAFRVMSLNAAHNLLTGFFHNSDWRVAWFCFTKACRSTWMRLEVTVTLYYYKHILRLTDDQIEARF